MLQYAERMPDARARQNRQLIAQGYGEDWWKADHTPNDVPTDALVLDVLPEASLPKFLDEEEN